MQPAQVIQEQDAKSFLLSSEYFGRSLEDLAFTYAMCVVMGASDEKELDLNPEGSRKNVLDRLKHRVRLGWMIEVHHGVPLIGNWSDIPFPDYLIPPWFDNVFSGEEYSPGHGWQEDVCYQCQAVRFDFNWICVGVPESDRLIPHTFCNRSCFETWWERSNMVYSYCIQTDETFSKTRPRTHLATAADIPRINLMKKRIDDAVVMAQVRDLKAAISSYTYVNTVMETMDAGRESYLIKLLIPISHWRKFLSDQNVITWKRLMQ